MDRLTTLRRVVVAIATAVGVVLGLTPDPTLAPVESHKDSVRLPA